MLDGTQSLLALIAEIAGVILLMLAALWLLRRTRPGGGAFAARDCVVIRSLALGARERLVVVQVGGRQLVLGVGAASVSLLCELSEPLARGDSGSELFGAAVRKALGRWHGG